MIHKAFQVTNDPLKLSQLSIDELHNQTKEAVARERDALVKVLHHLREVERRKLFSIYKRQSLFDYCVSELGYSEGAASRRIQAMRFIHEIPEVEEKVASGKLSLTNIAQAQSFFREVKKQKTQATLTSQQIETIDKLKVLKCLESKSSRQGQQYLCTLDRSAAKIKESTREVAPDLTQVTFNMDAELKNLLQNVRTLLGPKAARAN
ncbi:MAG: hypothetical protein COT74_07125 [Bdellovibrionales bacterium CG10_big_fil_rev_8_21_14_0_10_45_34]|nr:MAG: hypothetical protein COT74_07125 [Bdellovibrionales bacterium CG10_big_fil_rev_8_21_14_0_10_45_34]